MQKLLFILATIGIVSISAPLPAAVYRNWSIGMEREVDEGFYFKLVSVIHGWRIWRIETKDEVDCRAVKSAIGRIHPIPIGYGGAFELGTPYLMIYRGYKSPLTFSWNTVHSGKEKIQYRRMGEKFWTNGEIYNKDLTEFDGQKLEIAMTSWEYPEILVGFEEEKGVIDLAGMKAAVAAIQECNAAGKAQ
jgi:hypothetical protein